MATLIDKIRSNIKTRGILRGHSFLAEINVPRYLQTVYNSLGETLQYRCDTASLPGISLATIDGPARYGYGPIESIPYNVVYNETVLAFTVDRKSEIHRFFYDWMGVIVNFDNSQGLERSRVIGSSSAKTYEVGYKSHYSVDLKVKMLDEQLEPVLTCTMYKAFPKTINQIDLSWDQVNQAVKLQIPFSFREFTIEYHQ